MLQRFLDSQLLPDDVDDERFALMQAAAAELASELAAELTVVPSSTLVVLDGKHPDEEPALKRAETAVKAKWPTFRNQYRDYPSQILRSVLLEALHSAGNGNDTVASIIWLTGASYLPHAQLGQENNLLTEFLASMGSKAEKAAVAEWAGAHQSGEATLPGPGAVEFEVSTIGDDEIESLKLALAAASNNNYNPYQNQPNWSQAFAEGASTAIGSAVDALGQAIGERFQEVLSEIQAQTRQRVEKLREGLLNESRRKTELLWWREALYSSTLRDGYRSLPAATAVFIMAYDLHQQLPPSYPQSVEFLLREAVWEVWRDRRTSRRAESTLAQWCSLLSESTDLRSLIGQPKQEGIQAGRVPLLVLLEQSLAGNSPSSSDLNSRTGIAGATTIPADDLTVWILRDLQARRLAEGD